MYMYNLLQVQFSLCGLSILIASTCTVHVQYMYSTSSTMFLISSYGRSLAQRAPYLALHSSLFGPVAQLIMIILSLTALTLC